MSELQEKYDAGKEPECFKVIDDDFKELLGTCSPSGFELETRNWFKNFHQSDKKVFSYSDVVKDKNVLVYTDVMGNSYASLNNDSPYKVMISGHADEIGFQIVHINMDGFLSFRGVGGLDARATIGHKVHILHAEADDGCTKLSVKHVEGVIGHTTLHLLSENEEKELPKRRDMWIDIGASSKMEAESMVSVGDFVTYAPNLFQRGNAIFSKGIDDKVGVWIASQVVKRMNTFKKFGIVAVGTAQEEVSGGGAQVAVHSVKPRVVFQVDVDFSSDLPNSCLSRTGDEKAGKGAVLQMNADTNVLLLHFMKKVAAKHGIPFQVSATPFSNGGTDGFNMKKVESGVAVCNIGIPCRYMHTPNEMVSLIDVENTIKLISMAIEELEVGQTFLTDF